MAQKKIIVSDVDGTPIEDGTGATVRVVFNDARRGVREMDVTDEQAETILGDNARSVKRRGRKPGTTVNSASNGGEAESKTKQKLAGRS